MKGAPASEPASRNNRIEWLLRKIELLQGLEVFEYEQLVEHAELYELARRQVIYLRGDPGDAIYFVHGGRVKCSKVTRDGKELTLAYRGAGECFGELEVFGHEPRDEMAEAMKNAIITSIPAELMLALLERHPVMCRKFAVLIARRRRAMETKLEHLVFRDVPAKLAALLLELADDFGVPHDEGTSISLKITHQEMANLIGSTRETVSLTLAQFRDTGAILINGRAVTVTSKTRLHALI